MNNQNKTVTVSARIKESTLNKILKINKDFMIGSTGNIFNTTLNKSEVIERAIDILFELDLSDYETFLNVTGHVVNDFYKECKNTSQKYVLRVVRKDEVM